MTTPTIDEPLKACPFCGEKPERFPSGDGTGTMIQCMTNNCVGPCTSWYGKGMAEKVWNARPAPPADVAAAVDECEAQSCHGRDCAAGQVPHQVCTCGYDAAFAALRAKLGVGS